MPPPAKAPPEFPPAFHDLMRVAKVPMQHLAPVNLASLGVSIAAGTAETFRGLAKAYGVLPRDVLRAALVIGLEELLGCAKELGHDAANNTPNGV